MKLIVLTGGPGAGKTSILEICRKHFAEQVRILPEAASILFGGGFPRHNSLAGIKAAQRAIFYVQEELQRMAQEEAPARLILCDRGSLDGLAYWPGNEESFWREVKSSRAAEYAKYSMVIHLRTPTADEGYNHVNPLRLETSEEARLIDEKLREVWGSHPRYVAVSSDEDFLSKVNDTIQLIRSEI